MAKRAKPTGTLSTALEATRLLGKWTKADIHQKQTPPKRGLWGC
jgi:hypothetical protein